MIKTIITIVASVFLFSCVSQKKYDEMLSEKAELEVKKAALEEELVITQTKKEKLDKTVSMLKKDTAELNDEYRETADKLEALEAKHQTLQKYYNELSESSDKLSQNLVDKQKQLMEIEQGLEMQRLKNEKLSEGLAEREKKVEELEQILAEKDAAVKKLKDQVSNALLGFDESELSIEVKNGKVYVSMAEKLLFGSGSVAIDEEGKKAINQLGKLLSSKEEINIMVEGHTDNVPISNTSKYMNDNWDLSVMRATSIIRLLVNAGVPPERITAAGRGEWVPVTTNTTKEGKKLNRRTEIILTPQLDELFKILE